MEERQAFPPDDNERGMLPTAKAATSASMPTPKIEVTGVDEVMKKALEEAQEGYKATLREAQAVMKEAKDDHKAAVRLHYTQRSLVWPSHFLPFLFRHHCQKMVWGLSPENRV